MENDQAQLLKSITAFLEMNSIPYMITGAWSVMFYGRIRASHDIDFVVELHKEDIDRVLAAFVKLPHSEYAVQPEEIKEAIITKHFFNIMYLPAMLKLDFWLLTDTDFNKSRFSRRKKESILDQDMYVASPEDVILQKFLWYEEAKIEKHLVDAASVYQISEGRLNKEYLRQWAKKHKTTNYLKEISKMDLEKYH